AADDILRTLEALGLEWDGEVLYQSRRTGLYEEAFRRLVGRRLAYSCGCSRKEIAQIASAPHGEELVYPGICRDGLGEGKSERAFRVKVYDEVISFHDGIMGQYGQTLLASCGDFVIRRGDGPFAYHLAVVVDDAEMGVNQVVRGADLLQSTPRQIYLQRLLQYDTPRYYHLPLVTDHDGSKLSKREAAVSIGEGGLDPERAARLVEGALRFLGQEVPQEIDRTDPRFVLAHGIRSFDVSRVPTMSGPFPDLGSDEKIR
ncbi:MAG TPA: tRNA glutamyl-Q(34) synthetase GluQRS, partial [Verrucomicrobiae bacterium]|nr:tRNA glutamyl-Q(34) synthetase GluQRS [Verrucomicrobiae bacterium]